MADDSNPFAVPTAFSNVVLIIDDKKAHVSKEFLAIHSPVFAAMFFGEFAEKEKEEVELKDIEFINLLNVIYPGWSVITATSVSHILKLADRFQMKHALEEAEHFLMTGNVDVAMKLSLADQYNLQKVKDLSLNSIHCVIDIRDLKSSPLFDRYSDAMKSSICIRFMELLDTRRALNCLCERHY